MGLHRSFHRHLSTSGPLNLAGEATQHAGHVGISQKPSNTWHKPLFMDRLMPEQELLLVEMRDERSKAAPQLVSFDTVKHFKNT